MQWSNKQWNNYLIIIKNIHKKLWPEHNYVETNCMYFIILSCNNINVNINIIFITYILLFIKILKNINY